MGRTFALTALLAGLMAGEAAARDLAAMKPEEIRILQQRLTDAKCYSGPIDGLASPATAAAKKACPDQEPVLRIETGMHTAPIWRIAVDAACRVMATASLDKTVRIWSLPDGSLKQTIRLPIDFGKGGMARGVALSPDGRWVAVGGFDAALSQRGSHGLYVVDTIDQSTRWFGGFEEEIYHVAVSGDGARIGVSLYGKAGIRILDSLSGRTLMADRDYSDKSGGISFGKDGSVFATGFDGFIRRYGSDLNRTAKLRTHDGRMPYQIASDPAGERLAVGYTDTTSVSIYDAKTLKLIKKIENEDLNQGNLGSVAWSTDGNLWAAGKAEKGQDLPMIVRPFRSNGTRIGEDLKVLDNTIMDLKLCGNSIAMGTQDPLLGLISANRDLKVLQGPVTANMIAKIGKAFLVSSDGSQVRFGMDYGDSNAVTFDLTNASLDDHPKVSRDLVAPKVTGLPVTDWENFDVPMLRGKSLNLKPYDMSRSLAIRPNADGFVLGTEYNLIAFDTTGTKRWALSMPSITRGVNLAQDGNLIIAADGDGTIRWYRWSDGRELLALFVHKLDKRWVAWTPTGYYMASPGGEDLIGWHMNRGWEQAPDFFPASRFRDRFSRPDIVSKILTTLDEDEAVRLANAEAGKKETVKPIEAQLPPVIRITGPKDGTSFSAASLALDIDLRSPSNLAVTAIDIQIDGRPLADARGAGRSNAVETGVAACLADLTRGLSRTEAKPCRLTVPLPQKSVEVSLVARAGDLASEPATVKLAYSGAAPTADSLKPKLYVLAVGVADYADANLKLALAAKDARDFADAMKSQEGGLYSKVEVRPVVDRDATRRGILKGLAWLEKEVTSNDVGIVFLAGHGKTDEKGAFWYLPVDAEMDALRETAVSQAELRQTMSSLAGKSILFLDACHSGKAGDAMAALARGGVDINPLLQDLTAAENGIVVTFASSQGREVSLEDLAWGNGAFTRALLEGIRDGKADLVADGSVRVQELGIFIADRVKTLTGGRQHPPMPQSARSLSDYPLFLRR